MMKTIFPENTETFLIEGKVGQLELLTTMPSPYTSKKVAIICHPNPLQTGTMNNKVVTTLAKVFDQLGMATVRFNFRGIGKSEGISTASLAEADDLRAVVAWVKKVLPSPQLYLAGFSFGSYIAALVANEISPEGLVSIAPPVDRLDFTVLTKIHCPWTVVMGDSDEIVPPESVIEWAKHPPAPIEFILIPGVGHFFHGRLTELRDRLLRALN
jgi:alpha/beta superfamily hydrolase